MAEGDEKFRRVIDATARKIDASRLLADKNASRRAERLRREGGWGDWPEGEASRTPADDIESERIRQRRLDFAGSSEEGRRMKVLVKASPGDWTMESAAIVTSPEGIAVDLSDLESVSGYLRNVARRPDVVATRNPPKPLTEDDMVAAAERQRWREKTEQPTAADIALAQKLGVKAPPPVVSKRIGPQSIHDFGEDVIVGRIKPEDPEKRNRMLLAGEAELEKRGQMEVINGLLQKLRKGGSSPVPKALKDQLSLGDGVGVNPDELTPGEALAWYRMGGDV